MSLNLSEREKQDLEAVFSVIQVKKQPILKKYYKSMSKKLFNFFKKHIQSNTLHNNSTF